jgi:catechol 2,3-dioxygenase-like lactoylglutathione lyase family enzyme
MEPEVSFERVAPVIPVRDVDAAVERYRRLGFEVELYTDLEGTLHRVGSPLVSPVP